MSLRIFDKFDLGQDDELFLRCMRLPLCVKVKLYLLMMLNCLYHVMRVGML